MRITNVPQEYRALIRSVRRKANRYDINIRFVLAPQVSYDGIDWRNNCLGYFIYDEIYNYKELAVAINRPFIDWISVFIHESCHMDQQLSKEEMRNDEWASAYIFFFEWIDGKRQFNNTQVTNFMNKIIECERDCDIRAVEKIKQFDLPINIEEYIKKSNAYLFKYIIYREQRKWIQGFDENIWKLAPSTFDISYADIPKRMRRVYEKALKLTDNK